MRLHGFFRSGTSHRLRIALNLKGLVYEQVAVDLRREEHLSEAYKAFNPQQLVPALELGDGRVLAGPPPRPLGRRFDDAVAESRSPLRGS